MATYEQPADLARLSLNQMTTERWSVRDAIEGCVRMGIPSIGLWRHKVAEAGLDESARLVHEAGLRVSSLCRGGMFTAADAAGLRTRLDDNRRAVDEAAELNADVLVLVCGGLAGRDLDGARAQVEQGIADLLPYASERGVTLGIEPLHPAFVADRSVIATLGQANDLLERLVSPWVGVVIDTYHVWWDPQLYVEIERAAGRIVGFHVDDWPCANRDPLMGRGMMGDGVIDVRRIRRAVDATGFDGAIEVEIFNQEIWDRPGNEVLQLMRECYLACV
jgi:sugar phosphate isomerase/epimerase